MQAIRQKCLDCCCGVPSEVRATAVNCSLWPFRAGEHPLHRGEAGNRLQEGSSVKGQFLELDTPQAGGALTPIVEAMKRELSGFAEKTLGDYKEQRDGTVRLEIDYFDLTEFAKVVLGGQPYGDRSTGDPSG
jgi:hypothetical protein